MSNQPTTLQAVAEDIQRRADTLIAYGGAGSVAELWKFIGYVAGSLEIVLGPASGGQK